jgi:hypothetical protein
MKLEGFEKFYFEGTDEEKKELIEIHERNGRAPFDSNTVSYTVILFDRDLSIGTTHVGSRNICKSYTEAKAYLLRFAKPVMPDKVAKPKRKKSVAFNQGFVIDGARYTKTHIHGVSVERVKQEIRTLRLKLDRHTRLDKAGALDNR